MELPSRIYGAWNFNGLSVLQYRISHAPADVGLVK
jgi:hypothetical protein